MTGVLGQWEIQRHTLPNRLLERLQWVAEQDWERWEDGRIELSGRDYVNLEHSLTEPERARKWESHRDYLDVHVLLKGEERIDWAVLPDVKPVESYPERDLYFHAATIASQAHIRMRTGVFVVMYPWDLHRPLVAVGSPIRVRKAILKLHVADMIDASR